MKELFNKTPFRVGLQKLIAKVYQVKFLRGAGAGGVKPAQKIGVHHLVG
jgi:hypothetical protein